MEDFNKIEIVDTNGEIIEVEIKLYFNYEETGKDYIIYTKNEYDGDKLKIYVGFVTETDDEITIEKISDPEEWNTIKKCIRVLIKESVVEINE